MQLEDVRRTVGPARFDAACRAAWQTAAGTGSTADPPPWPDELADVPHEIDDLWLDDTVPAPGRLELSFRVYRAMPCYWNTVGWRWLHPQLSAAERELMWERVRALLDDPDDRLADPVVYGLWCDWFEDAATVAPAWTQTTARPHTGLRLARVLRVSGPVPYDAKRDLLWTLAADRRWHDAIGQALDAAANDVFGDLDRADGRRLRRSMTPGP